MNTLQTKLRQQAINDYKQAYHSKRKSDHEARIASSFFPSYVKYLSKGINQLHSISPYLSAKITLKVLSVALRRRLSKKDRQFYDHGQKQMYKVSKHRFYTYTYGDGGPVLLLLHGFCSNGARWRNYVLPLIEAGYQIVVMDAPGHGTSPGHFMSVPTYIDCVKEVLSSRLKWDAIVTHSMGGVVSAVALGELGNIQPNKYVLLNSFSTGDSMMSTFARRIGINEKLISDLRKRVEQNTGRPLEHYSLEMHLGKFDLNGLMIHDLDDNIVPRSEAHKNSMQLNHFKSVKTKALGHNLFSKEVEKTVINFLTKEMNHNPRIPFPCVWERYL